MHYRSDGDGWDYDYGADAPARAMTPRQGEVHDYGVSERLTVRYITGRIGCQERGLCASTQDGGEAAKATEFNASTQEREMERIDESTCRASGCVTRYGVDAGVFDIRIGCACAEVGVEFP